MEQGVSRLLRSLLWFWLAMVPMLLTATVRTDTLDVVILGDSNTWLGGNDCNQPRGWNKWFADDFGARSCRSYARSGATWTNTPVTRLNTVEVTGVLGNDNVIYNQVQRLLKAHAEGRQAAPHVVIIAAGTNDVWFAASRPSAFSRTVDEVFDQTDTFITRRPVNQVLSLAESVRYSCELLAEAFPTAQLVLLTPLQTTAVPLDSIRRAAEVIEGCARRMGLCVVRQDQECCVYRARELRRKTFTTDGTHTNAAGARRNGLYLSRRLKTMLSQ